MGFNSGFKGLKKSKVKFTLEQVMKVHRGSRGIAVIFNPALRWGGWSPLDGVGGQRQSPAVVPPGKKHGAHSKG